MSAFFQNTLFSGWVADDFVSNTLSYDAELEAIFAFEVALAKAQATHSIISSEDAENVANVLETFSPDIDALRQRVSVDGMLIPGLMAQIKSHDPKVASVLHKGATSQDALDTATMLRAKAIFAHFAQSAHEIIDQLSALKDEFGLRPLMAVTRKRAALPILVGDRLKAWMDNISNATQLIDIKNDIGFSVQLGGPTGVSYMADKVRGDLAGNLGLSDPGYCWHTNRAPIAELGYALVVLTTSLAKLGKDLGQMSQDGVRTAKIAGGGSSAMAHKVNPVDTELLAALGSHIATLQGGLLGASVHEYERDGACWTLEWMTLPDMFTTAGAALKAASRLLSNIEELGDPE